MTGMLWLLAMACSEYTVQDSPPPPTAQPPEQDTDDFGDAPDWTECPGGFAGEYFNLQNTHPDVAPNLKDPEIDSPDSLDWWDEAYLSYEEYAASLDYGTNWWPVDDGYADDPAYFSARWMAWIRVWDDAAVEFTIGSSDDLWVTINGQDLIARPGIQDFATETVTLDLEAGQYPLEVRYAHRSGDSGMRFRPIGSTVTICYPEFTD